MYLIKTIKGDITKVTDGEIILKVISNHFLM